MIVLAFETSCDETCAAVVEKTHDGRLKVLSNVVSSQIDIHKLYGGVVPEVASRNHLLTVENVFKQALKAANITLAHITEIAATTQPGLVGAVMVGRVFAESLASARGIPFIEVNHLTGHIASVMLTNPELKPPFVCLIASGGHTSLYKISSGRGRDKTTGCKTELLGSTLDDACGEAFDKVAKVLNLGYPGGPKIAGLAEKFNMTNANSKIRFVRNPNYAKSLDFSYSGLKSAVINYIKKNPNYNLAEIASVFQHEAIEQLVIKCNLAKRKLPLAVCGGVAANAYLRKKLPDAFFPELSLCGDNAAMIAAASMLFKGTKL